MQVVAGVIQKPGFHLRMLAAAIVVQHKMEVHLCRNILVYVANIVVCHSPIAVVEQADQRLHEGGIARASQQIGGSGPDSRIFVGRELNDLC